MKRIVYTLITISILILVALVFIKPVIVALAQRQLQNMFTESRVSIGGCYLKPASQLSFLDITIKKENVYNFDIKEARVSYNFLSIFKRNVPIINYFDIKINSFDGQSFQLENAYLKISQTVSVGELYIKQIKYNKARIGEIKSKVKLEDKTLLLHSLSAKTLDGKIVGDISLKIDKNQEFFANLKFINLNINTFVKDFDLNKKFEMSGELTGTVTLKGRGFSNIDILKGTFSFIEPGGLLTIKDNKFLENMARSSGQSLSIIAENFKHYSYNTGIVKLFLNKDNLILEAGLDGESGKRNLNITVHDFLKYSKGWR